MMQRIKHFQGESQSSFRHMVVVPEQRDILFNARVVRIDLELSIDFRDFVVDFTKDSSVIVERNQVDL